MLSSAVMAAAMLAATVSDVEELASRLPADANTAAVVRVQEILESPRAVREDWKDQQKSEFLAGAATIPHFVDTVVIGSLVQPARGTELWSSAIVTLPFPLEMSMIAAFENSFVEKLDDTEAVRSSGDAYFLKLGEQMLGVLNPATRQDAVRWVRKMRDSRGVGLNDYLVESLGEPGHLVMAMDVREMFEPQRTRERLELIERDDFDRSTVDRMVDLLTGMRGIRLTATVDDETTAVVTMDFAEEVGLLGPQVQAVFLEMIADQQVFLDDFTDATLDTDGNVVTLTTKLSDAGLRAVMSLLVSPQPHHDAPALTGRSSDDVRRARVDLDATIDYYRKVNQTLEDLERANRRAKDYARTATWHEKFAEKIENLPLTGVDPLVVDYANRLAAQFRALAASLRGVAVEVNAQQRSVVYDVQVDPGFVGGGWWGAAAYRPGSYQVKSNLREVRERQAAAVARGAEQRQQIWQIIHEEQAEVRQKLFDKYGVDFNDPKAGK